MLGNKPLNTKNYSTRCIRSVVDKIKDLNKRSLKNKDKPINRNLYK